MSGSEADLGSVLTFVFLGILWLIWAGRLFWAMTAPLRQGGAKPQADRLSRSDVEFLRSLPVKPWELSSGLTRASEAGTPDLFGMQKHDS